MQKKQTDAQQLNELEESLRLMDETETAIPKKPMTVEDDAVGMDEFWAEQLEKAERKVATKSRAGVKSASTEKVKKDKK